MAVEPAGFRHHLRGPAHPILALTQLHLILPFALTVVYTFLSIRLEEITVLDYVRYAGKLLILSQQKYVWRARKRCTQFAHLCQIMLAKLPARKNGK